MKRLPQAISACRRIDIGVILALCIGVATAQETGNGHPIALKSVNVTLPASADILPPGPGADLANAYCLICHSAGMVTRQPALDRQVWQGIVNKMRAAYGAPIPEDKVAPLVDYLARNYGAKSGEK
jgi:cytochrome c5